MNKMSEIISETNVRFNKFASFIKLEKICEWTASLFYLLMCLVLVIVCSPVYLVFVLDEIRKLIVLKKKGN